MHIYVKGKKNKLLIYSPALQVPELFYYFIKITPALCFIYRVYQNNGNTLKNQQN